MYVVHRCVRSAYVKTAFISRHLVLQYPQMRVRPVSTASQLLPRQPTRKHVAVCTYCIHLSFYHATWNTTYNPASLTHQKLNLLLVLTSHGVGERCHSVLVLGVHSRSQRDEARDHRGLPPISCKMKRRSPLFVLRTTTESEIHGTQKQFQNKTEGTQ